MELSQNLIHTFVGKDFICTFGKNTIPSVLPTNAIKAVLKLHALEPCWKFDDVFAVLKMISGILKVESSEFFKVLDFKTWGIALYSDFGKATIRTRLLSMRNAHLIGLPQAYEMRIPKV